MSEIRLDLRGLKCPLPALRTRKALERAAPGTILLVECTDPLAAIDLANLARERGDALLSRVEAEGYAIFRILRAAP